MRKIGWLVLVALFAFSCNNDSKIDTSLNVQEGEVKSKLSSGSVSAEELEKAAEERRIKREEAEKERIANFTTMEILPDVHDFGMIPKETPMKKIFKVKNTGDKPLIINDAKATCGCTVPRWPEEPIMPGEEGELEVIFESTPAQAGTKINKRITLTANIEGSTQYCTIRGQVED